MIHLLSMYRVREEEVEAAKEVVSEFVDAVKDNETQTPLYFSFQDSGRPNLFYHVIAFENEDAKKRHESAEYTKIFREKLYPLCEKEPIFIDLTMVKCNKHL